MQLEISQDALKTLGLSEGDEFELSGLVGSVSDSTATLVLDERDLSKPKVSDTDGKSKDHGVVLLMQASKKK